MSWFSAFFSWPNGGVWSNLAASVIWTLPALRWHHKKIQRNIDAALAAPGSTAPENTEARS